MSSTSWSTLWSKRETPNEEEALSELRGVLRGELASLATSLPADDAFAALLSDAGEGYDACLRRFLVHNDLVVDKAAKQLRTFVAWRRSQHIGALPAAAMRGPSGGLPVVLIPERGARGETMLFSSGRHYVKRQCLAEAHGDAVARLFEALLYAADGAQAKSVVLVADFDGVTLSQVDMPAFRRGLATFLNYYPQSFSKVLLVAYPKFIHGLWRAVRPLLDERTIQSVEWCETRQDVVVELRKFFVDEQIPTWLGGSSSKWPVDVLCGVDDPAALQRELIAKYRVG